MVFDIDKRVVCLDNVVIMSKYNKSVRKDKSYDWIKKYKGEYYNGEWPTIPQILEICGHRYNDKKFLETFFPAHQSYTYGKTLALVRKIAKKINSLVSNPGTKIIVSGVNSPEWVICYLAISYSGNIVIPLDNQLHENEIINLTKFSEAKIAFIDSSKRKLFETLDMISLISLDSEKLGDDFVYIEDWVKDVEITKSDEEYRKQILQGNVLDLAAILFTSGTTGNPKGVMLTHFNLVSDSYLAQSNLVISSDDVFYAILPIHHAYTMVAAFLTPLSQGSSIVFGKKLVTKQIFYDVKEGKVSVFLGVPALFNKVLMGLMAGLKSKSVFLYGIVRFLMNFFATLKFLFGVDMSKSAFKFLTSKVALDKVRICISGGGPLSAKIVSQYLKLGIPFIEGYGMTETSPVITLNPMEAYKYHSVGKVIEGIEVKIVDPDSDGNGLVYVKGPIVMKGYYKNPEATSQTIDEDGFINTGDIGHLDKDNYLYLTGRKKNIIVTSGGKNVFPEEIEDEFQLYDDIEQIMIAGYAKPDHSEGIMAIVCPSKKLVDLFDNNREKCQKKIQEYVDLVNKRLSSYKKITKLVLSYKPLPITSTKKIKRAEVLKMIHD